MVESYFPLLTLANISMEKQNTVIQESLKLYDTWGALDDTSTKFRWMAINTGLLANFGQVANSL